MKLPIKYFIFCGVVLPLCLFVCQASPIHIHYGINEKQEVQWVRSILIRLGIPSDYIELSISHNGCNANLRSKRDNLLQLCLDKSKKLNVMKFRKKEFFWTLGPLIENT